MTGIDTKRQLHAVMHEYPIGARVLELTLAGRGSMGQVWRLVTEIGSWAVKLLHEPPDPDLLDNEMALLTRATSITRSIPLLTSTGSSVLAVDQGHVRVAAWLEGEHPARPSEVATRVGALLARLHKIDAPYRVAFPAWYNELPTAVQWSDLVDRFSAVSPQCADMLRAAAARLGALGEIPRPPMTDLISCHRDIKPANILVRGDSSDLVVLDWENAGAATPSRELASVIMHWSRWWTPQRDAAIARAIHEGYHAAGGRGQLSTLEDFGLYITEAGNHLYVVALAELANPAGPDGDRLSWLASLVLDANLFDHLLDVLPA
ncbi:phosphotransferase [Nocardia sp. NPDC051570]|uniref:phosphotransferase n=1 Tax=Nocardia sp. NPDC051570 TaxID=3364324 RepID=UPI0037BD5A17